MFCLLVVVILFHKQGLLSPPELHYSHVCYEAGTSRELWLRLLSGQIFEVSTSRGNYPDFFAVYTIHEVIKVHDIFLFSHFLLYFMVDAVRRHKCVSCLQVLEGYFVGSYHIGVDNVYHCGEQFPAFFLGSAIVHEINYVRVVSVYVESHVIS